MKMAAIAVVLITLALKPSLVAAEQKIPMLVSLSSEGRYLQNRSYWANQEYQLEGHQSVAFQPVHWAWFYLGARNRFTHFGSQLKSITEPVRLHLAAHSTVLADFLSVSVGMSLPLSNALPSLADSTAVHHFANGFQPNLEPDVLPISQVFLATYCKQEWSRVTALLGFRMVRPGNTLIYPGYRVRLGAQYKSFLSLTVPGRSLQRVDISSIWFSPERDEQARLVHQEGTLVNVRYHRSQHIRKGGLRWGGGLALQAADKSRRFLAFESLRTNENDNVQSITGEVDWYRPQWRRSLLHLHLAGSALLQPADFAQGEDSVESLGSRYGFLFDLGFSVKTMWGRGHLIRIAPSLVFGSWFGEAEDLAPSSPFGGSVNISYSLFRNSPAENRFFPERP